MAALYQFVSSVRIKHWMLSAGAHSNHYLSKHWSPASPPAAVSCECWCPSNAQLESLEPASHSSRSRFPEPVSLTAAVQHQDLRGLCSHGDVFYDNSGRIESAIVILPLAPIAFSAE